MTTDPNVTPVRLPHTGMRVPDRSLSVSAFRQRQTYDGVAYSANLRLNYRIVGLIENGGHGGPTAFFARGWREFGEEHLTGYATRCRTEEGAPVTAEMLLDHLIDEHVIALNVAARWREKQTVLRLLDHVLDTDGQPVSEFPPYQHDESCVPTPRNDHQWDVLARLFAAFMPPGEHGWWQAWTGDRWRDLTPRPNGIPSELYG